MRRWRFEVLKVGSVQAVVVPEQRRAMVGQEKGHFHAGSHAVRPF